MASLAEKYVFERLAMLEKEHDEHIKGSSVNVEKEPENTDGVEFKKEPIKAVRYITIGSWVFEDKDYGLNDVDRLREVLEMDDKHLYEWATDSYGEGWHKITHITRQETEFAYQVLDMRVVPNAIYASEKNSVGYFQHISDTATVGSYCTLDNDDAAKAKAIKDIRYTIKCAIDNLERGTEEEEEETEDE